MNTMKSRIPCRAPPGILLLAIGLLTVLTAAPAAAGNFWSNFLKPQYFLPITRIPDGLDGADLNAQYEQLFVRNYPGTELLIIGEYPRARFFAITLYDDHGAVIGTLNDTQIQPLNPGQSNPFGPGGTANTEDVMYAVRVRLKNQVAVVPTTECDTGNVTINQMDGRYRHTAGTWYSSFHRGFSVTLQGVPLVHDDAIDTSSISIMVRRYLPVNDGNTGQFDLRRPLVLIRSNQTGCAFNLYDALGKPEPDPPVPITLADWYSTSALVKSQTQAHWKREVDAPQLTPYGLDPYNSAAWYRGPEYLLLQSPDAAYLSSKVVQSGQPAVLNAAQKVMRLRFRLPAVPCAQAACPLNGTHDLRYWGLSFLQGFASGERNTLASISDLDLRPDANGYVSLLVTFGTPLPAHVNAANGYSVVSLPDVTQVDKLMLRLILPQAAFTCAPNNIPFRTNEHHSGGGYMGDYAPFVDFPVAATLPLHPVLLVRNEPCGPPLN